MNVRWKMAWLVALVACTTLGCGGGPELGKVTGTVTLDGEPIEGAGLMFVPQAGATVQRIAYAVTDAEGHYDVQFSRTKAGVAVGNCSVGISTSDDAVWKGESYSGKELFPEEYHSDYKTVEIVSGNNVFDFACKTGGAKPIVEEANSVEEGY